MRNPVARFVLAAAFLTGSAADAHVVLEQKSAPAASYYKATFMVGHGCEGSPTTSIRIAIPPGVIAVKPMPKTGWMLRTRIESLNPPQELHGKPVTEAVAEVSWDGGNLADSNYDEFVMLMRLPADPGKLYFKAIQGCEQGENRWEQIPEAGRTTRDYRYPAAVLDVLPAPGAHH